MIITARADKCESVLSHLTAKDIKAAVIGKVVDADRGLTVQSGNEEKLMRRPEADPYWDAFFSAFKKGWK